jgi:G:T-mismatch repair DNA endonuclease (very short patch repair protein)
MVGLKTWADHLPKALHIGNHVVPEARRVHWRVLRIWEHELARKNEVRLVRRIRHTLGQAAK